MNAKLEELKTRLYGIHDLQMSRAILGWDQHTMMPPRGGEVRAEQLGTLDSFSHELFIDDEIGRLLEDLRGYEESLDPDTIDASLIRTTRRDYDKAKRVTPELRAELTRAGAMALPAWVEAREKSDFSIFLPYLKRNVELQHEYIACFEGMGFDSEYDVLLDDFDEGMTADAVREVFDELKRGLVPLIAEIAKNTDRVDDSSLHGDFPVEGQRAFALEILQRLGYDHESWRLDPTVHPFAMSAGTHDIRLTTRYDETDLSVSLWATIHEFGHGFYEANVDPAMERTSLSSVTSMSLHESQSRMWENLVGRGLPLWRFFYPKLQAAFPAQFGDVELDEYYGAINKVQPSLIRVEADEATYNLHIILRFELEQEILSGELPLEDLPEAWNARMSEYLGIDVPDDAHGVLQDVHWSGGAIGYFPTYALGNVVSVQLWDKARGELPDLDSQFEQGEFGDLSGWLRENLHRHGRKYTSKEMLDRIVGGPMDPAPYLRYLREKLGEIYGLPVETGATV
ncbi:MAG: carboxypeptidase M32 [Actinomycetota bacterium]